MPRWTLTLDINAGEYELEVEIWADLVLQQGKTGVLADTVFIEFDSEILIPPRLSEV